MNFTRRNVTIGGLSLLASTSMSTMGRAEFGEFLGIGEGFEDFAQPRQSPAHGGRAEVQAPRGSGDAAFGKQHIQRDEQVEIGSRHKRNHSMVVAR